MKHPPVVELRESIPTGGLLYIRKMPVSTGMLPGVTAMKAKGCTPLLVAERLGHEKVQTTMDT